MTTKHAGSSISFDQYLGEIFTYYYFSFFWLNRLQGDLLGIKGLDYIFF